MKPKTLIATFGFAALVLAACGSPGNFDEDQVQNGPSEVQAQDDQQGQDQTVVMGHGTYELEFEGAVISFELPADKDSLEIEEFEQLRKDVKGDPVSYLVADVDNREGRDSIYMSQVDVFDEEGDRYTFGLTSEYLVGLQPEQDLDSDDLDSVLADGTVVSFEEGLELVNRVGALLNETSESAVGAAGRDTLILVYEGNDLPDEFTRVAVWPGDDVDDVDAYPAE